MKEVKEGEIYRHFKGPFYYVICVGLDSETRERIVVYRHLDGSNIICVRPEKMFLEEIPENQVEGLQEITTKKEDSFEDSSYSWGYGKTNKNVTSYQMNSEKAGKINSEISKTKTNTYNFRSAESFLNSLTKPKEETLDLSKYKAGVRVYHKKFGEGTINYVEKEGDDLKVDITFDKAGHKRLMAKFAGLEIV